MNAIESNASDIVHIVEFAYIPRMTSNYYVIFFELEGPYNIRQHTEIK